MNDIINHSDLTEIERKEIQSILNERSGELESDLEQMWYLLDTVWDKYECDNIKLNWDQINKFYSHPVWLLNGLFIEQHEISMQHRGAISDWIVSKNFKLVVDYGGGLGTLARLINQKSKAINVSIFEPHPMPFALRRLQNIDNIKYISEINGEHFDCLVSTDVLEHVPNPLETFSKMISLVKTDGFLIIANCFTPIEKCHLPRTFHLRFSFNLFAKLFGLKVLGPLENSHATIYQKTGVRCVPWFMIKTLELISRITFTILKSIKDLFKKA